jgi:hypothetical protein
MMCSTERSLLSMLIWYALESSKADQWVESESGLYCSVVPMLFHSGGEFVGVVLTLTEGVR